MSEVNYRHIFITGPPGCGKSTVIRRIIEQLDAPATGFYTSEIIEEKERAGFSLESLSGESGVLAHARRRGSLRVGKYGVDIGVLEKIAVPSLVPENEDTLVVCDEIGKMESLSSLFCTALWRLLENHHKVLGSIALGGHPFVDKVRNREDVLLIRVTKENRNSLPSQILAKLVGDKTD